MTAPSLDNRVERLESGFEEIKKDFAGVVTSVDEIRASMQQIAQSLGNTNEQAAQRANAVKVEIRDEADRKARDRSALFKDGLALLGFVFVVVAAFGGPYLNKVNATSDATEANTRAVGAVRETLAQHGADIQRNKDQAEISRDRAKLQDERQWDMNARLARLEAFHEMRRR